MVSPLRSLWRPRRQSHTCNCTHGRKRPHTDKLQKVKLVVQSLLCKACCALAVQHTWLAACYWRGGSVKYIWRYAWDVETPLCSQEETQSGVLSSQPCTGMFIVFILSLCCCATELCSWPASVAELQDRVRSWFFFDGLTPWNAWSVSDPCLLEDVAKLEQQHWESISDLWKRWVPKIKNSCQQYRVMWVELL